VAFVGAGRVADVHYYALSQLGARAELVGFCETRPAATAQREAAWRVPGFPSMEALLDGVECDAVCLLLPHDVHRQCVSLAAGAGKAILLEKPLASDPDDAQAIVAECRAAGVLLMVGHNGLFHPAFERAVELIRGGAIGRPLFGQAKSTQWLGFRPWDFRLSLAKTGGGCWIDCAGHLVYRLREIFGEAADVCGMAANLARPEMEGEDFAAAVLRYRSGALAQLTISYGLKLPGYEHDWPRGCEQSLVIAGDRGTLEYNICPHPGIRLFSEVEGARSPALQGWTSEETAAPFEDSFVRQMAHFLDCVHSGQTPRVSGEDALEVLRVLTAFYHKGPFAQREPRHAHQEH
jgi:predicted dehydrogenase